MVEIGKENFVRPYMGRLDLSKIPELSASEIPDVRKWYKIIDPSIHPDVPSLVWLYEDSLTGLYSTSIWVFLNSGNPPPDVTYVLFLADGGGDLDTLPSEVVEPALNALRRYQVVTPIEEAFTFFLVIVAGLALAYLVSG